MGLEQALGIRLTLVAQLGNAAREVSGELNAVAESLKAVRDLGKQFTLDGITQLNKEVTSLNQRASAAAKSVGALSQNLKEVEGAGNAAASGVNASAGAADRVRTAASGAAQSVIKMGDAMSRAKEQGSALATLHTGFDLIEQSAGAATTKVNAFADAVLRLAGVQRLALSGGPSAYAPRYGPIPQSAYGSPAFIPLPGGAQYALPSGDGPRYAPIPQPAYRSSATAALTGAEMLALSGGTEPNFNARAWWANQRAQGTSQGSGPAMSVPPGGFGGGGGGGGFGGFFSGGGAGMKKFGDQMQSQGWALAVNGGMLAAALVPAIKAAMDIDDLLHRTYEALKAGGATEAAAKQFADATRNIARQTGSNYRETVSAGYNFISAMPSGLNLNDPKVMQAVIQGYKRTAMMTVAGSSSTHQVSMEEGALDVNNVIANLGLDTSTPAKLAQAYKLATNILINTKNRTSTEIDMMAQSIKGIGPIGKEMGVDPEEMVALIAMEAEGKIRGATAGYAIKRLLQRQSVPSQKTLRLINTVRKLGGNISLFDDSGHIRPLLDVMADTTKFEDTHHLSDANKSLIQGQLAGLYAVGNLDLMQDQIRRHGGSAGARAFGHSLMYGTIAGGKTGDATIDSYHARAQGNTRIQASKVSADFQDTAFKTFKDIQPFLTSLLKDVDGLINAFDRLPKPVKDGAAEFLILGTMFSVVAGGAAILIGNFIKFGGVVMEVVGVGVKVVGWVGELVTNFGILETAGEVVGGVITALAGILTLPVIAIGALVAAIGLGVVAWVKDWGGIREKTAAVIQWIVQEIPKIPAQLGYMVGRAAMFLAEWGVKWADFWMHFPETAYNGIKFVVGYLVDNVPKWADAGLKAILSWGNAILKALPGIGKEIMGGIEAVLNALNPVTWVKAGIGLAQNFIHGIVQGVKDGKPGVKNALQGIRDLHPGSEPKDSSSPLYGMSKSGQAFSDNFINGILDGFRNGKAKVKKGAKAISDVFVDLRGESVAEVIKTTKAIEDELTRQGAVIKNKWMDLMSGGHVTRFYGDPTAVHQAVKEDKGPDPLRGATDYLKRLGEYPQTYQQIMSKLHAWLNAANAAELSHEVSSIDALIARVQKAHDAALTKLGKPFDSKSGLFAQIDKQFQTEGNEGNSFDTLQQKDDAKLQRMIQMRKNQELPTLAELNKELTLEINERDALQKIYVKEIQQRDALVALMDKTLQQANAINATDQASSALKAKLIAQAKGYSDELDNLNGRLDDQEIVITKLNKSIGDYSTQIKSATDHSIQWSQILSSAFITAGNDALKSLGDTISNGLDSMLSRVFGAKRQGIAGFIGSFFADLFSNVAHSIISGIQKQMSDSLTNTVMSFFTQITTAANPSSAPAAAPTLQDAFSALGTLSSSDSPQKVQITDSSGNDLGVPLVNGLRSLSQATGQGASSSTSIPSTGSFGAASGMLNASGTGLSLNGALDVGMGAFGIGSEIGNMESGGGPGNTHGIFGGIGALAGVAGVSMMFGGMGGIAGLLAAGPAGWAALAAAAVIGGIAGGAFGHKDNPALMPDKYATASWGQENANLWGASASRQMHANGQSFVEDSATSQITGGQGMLQWISAWIAANPTQAASVLGASNVSLFSGLNVYTPITGGHDGNLNLANGHSMNYQQLYGAAQGAMGKIQALGNNALAASESADRLAASFTSLILGGPAGFNIPLLVGASGGGWGAIGGGIGGGLLPGEPRRPEPPSLPKPGGPRRLPPSQPIRIHILEGATITSDIEAQIKAVLPKVATALASVVNRSNYQQQRMYGDYVSAIS